MLLQTHHQQATLRAHAAACRPRRMPLRVSCYRDSTQPRPSASSIATPPATQHAQEPSSASAPTLSREERQSLHAYMAAAGLPASDAAALQLPQAVKQQVAATIAAGLAKQEPDLAKLEGAMLLAEAAFHAAGGNDPAALSAATPQAVDMWQPIFASAGGFPRLLYIPVPEYFDMHRALPDAMAISIDAASGSIDATSSPERAAAAAAGGGRINIITELGPLVTHFLGSANWVNDNTFCYSISQVRLDIGGRSFTIGLGPFKLQNELSFFMTTPELACARSKLGGTMLLRADPEVGRRYFTTW